MWNSGEMDIETANAGNGGKGIVLMAQTVAELTVSSIAVTMAGYALATLPSSANGTIEYCSDCTVTTPATCLGVISASCICAGSGNGAFAKRLNGAWYCN
jgi:hypothetical protein